MKRGAVVRDRRHLKTVSDLINDGYELIFKSKDYDGAIVKLEQALKNSAGIVGIESYLSKYKLHKYLSYCYAKTIESAICGYCLNEWQREHWLMAVYHCRLQLDFCKFINIGNDEQWRAKERLIFFIVKKGYLRLAVHMCERLLKECGEHVTFKRMYIHYRIGSLWQTIGSEMGQDAACTKCRQRLADRQRAIDKITPLQKAISSFEYVLAIFDDENCNNEKGTSMEKNVEQQLQEFDCLKGKALGSIGNCYYHLTDYVSAIFYYTERLALSKKMKDIKGQCRANYNLGNAYISLDKLKLACECYVKAVNCSKLQPIISSSSLMDTAFYACALATAYNLSKSHQMVIKWFKSALSYLSAARSLSKTDLDRNCELYAYDGLIRAYKALGDEITSTRLIQQRAKLIKPGWGGGGHHETRKGDNDDDDDDELSCLLKRMDAGCIKQFMSMFKQKRKKVGRQGK